MSVSTASHCMIYVTAVSADEARFIGRTLVEEKLAACVNIMDGVTSIYRWEGKIEEAKEAVLIAKTRFDLAHSALERIEELHSNEAPCAVAYEMTLGLANYLAWVDDETAN